MLLLDGMSETTLTRVNAVTERVIGAASQVHRTLGPGLLESVYLACLLYELRTTGLSVETQYKVPIQYGDVQIECGYRIDVLVEATVILEVKAVGVGTYSRGATAHIPPAFQTASGLANQLQH